jgi:hypothetical protein
MCDHCWSAVIQCPVQVLFLLFEAMQHGSLVQALTATRSRATEVQLLMSSKFPTETLKTPFLKNVRHRRLSLLGF